MSFVLPLITPFVLKFKFWENLDTYYQLTIFDSLISFNWILLIATPFQLEFWIILFLKIVVSFLLLCLFVKKYNFKILK